MCSDGSGDVLADLGRALDRVAAEDLKGMFGPQVLARTRALTARHPDGRWRTYRPDGTEILMPEPLLAAG